MTALQRRAVTDSSLRNRERSRFRARAAPNGGFVHHAVTRGHEDASVRVNDRRNRRGEHAQNLERLFARRRELPRRSNG
ncbi:MAG: hypothetical protein ACRD2J_13880, partial [Thermoanaerobaculia bacterium]